VQNIYIGPTKTDMKMISWSHDPRFACLRETLQFRQFAFFHLCAA